LAAQTHSYPDTDEDDSAFPAAHHDGPAGEFPQTRMPDLVRRDAMRSRLLSGVRSGITAVDIIGWCAADHQGGTCPNEYSYFELPRRREVTNRRNETAPLRARS
jgi:hypothetical protein